MIKKSLTKIILIIVAASIVTLGVIKLAALGSAAINALNSEQNETNKKDSVTINFIHWSNFPREIFTSFSQKYPNIKVEFEQYGRQHYPEVQRARMSSGENVDIMAVMENDYESFVKNGYLVNLTDKDYINNYRLRALEDIAELRQDKKVFAVPYKSWVLGIWYNKIFFNRYGIEIPNNYNEFLEACRILKANGVNPMVLGCRDEWVSSYIYYIRIWNSAGYDRNWFRKLNSGEITWMHPSIVQSFEDVESFIKKGYILKDSINLSYHQAFNEFIKGRAAMCLAGDWSMDMIEPGIEKAIELGMFPIPYNDEGLAKMVPGTNAGFLMGIFSGSHKKDEADLLLDYLSQPEVAQVYVDETKSSSNILEVDYKKLKYNQSWEQLRMSEYITPLTVILPRNVQNRLNKSAKELLIGSKTARQILQELDDIQ
ncbi:MAG: ABC transporter substrate-binding protein [Clostridia bacterium]|nr:ABC transporter substrate-binding protein [Clostridia bacterium]